MSIMDALSPSRNLWIPIYYFNILDTFVLALALVGLRKPSKELSFVLALALSIAPAFAYVGAFRFSITKYIKITVTGNI